MNSRGLLFVILGMLALLLSGCGGGPERNVLRGGTRHLPLLHDRTLKYVERTGSETKSYSIRLFYSGGHEFRVYSIKTTGVDLGHTEFISDSAHVWYVTSQPLTAIVPLDQYQELWVDESAKEGTVWHDEFTGQQTVFAGYETIEIGSSTYPDCYKTVTTPEPFYLDSLTAWRDRGAIGDDEFNARAANAGMVVVRWFAQGVGLVREQFGNSGRVRELVSIENPGVGKDAPSNPEPPVQPKNP